MVDEDGRSLILILQDKKRKDIPIKVGELNNVLPEESQSRVVFTGYSCWRVLDYACI